MTTQSFKYFRHMGTDTLSKSSGTPVYRDPGKAIVGYSETSDVSVGETAGEFKSGVYRVTPYTRETVSHQAPSVEFDALGYPSYGTLMYRPWISGTVWPMIQNVGSFTTSIPTTLMEAALLAAEAKVGAARLDVGETLGEITETFHTLHDPLASLRELFSPNFWREFIENWQVYMGLRRKTPGNSIAMLADNLASTWLEIRYGLLPVMYFIQDAVKYVDDLERKTFKPIVRSKVRNLKDSSRVPTIYNKFTFGGSSATGVVEYRMDMYEEHRVHASVQYKQTAGVDLATDLGLSPFQIPELALELTRLSFVVDWWFSLGDWLGAHRYNPSFDVLGNTVSHTSTYIKVGTAIAARVSATSWPVVGRLPSGLHLGDSRRMYHRRYVNFERPSTPVCPTFDVVNLHRAIDLASLALKPFLQMIKPLRVLSRSLDYTE